jgi:hypothetical protein
MAVSLNLNGPERPNARESAMIAVVGGEYYLVNTRGHRPAWNYMGVMV